MSAILSPTRRGFLGQSALFSIAALGGGFTLSAMASNSAAPIKVRFAVGDSFVVGNLYLPAGYRAGIRYPALVAGGSLTSVKEQMGGLYAAAMAARGYIALAVDYRHYGESGGEPRQYEDPEAKAEDLVAAVSYLSARDDVRPESIGLVGICTSGGTVFYAAAREERIAAIASVAGHFAEASILPGLYGGAEGVERRRMEGRAARAHYEATGENRLILAYHNEDRSASHVGPMEYYMDGTRGGGVSAWTNAFAVMSWENWLDFDPISKASAVKAPVLIVHSDGCALPDQARKAYELVTAPKALHWSEGYHFDFYDDEAKLAEVADAIAAHFGQHMA